MTIEEIEQLALKASGAEINGYRFGQNGREPIYGIPTETEDGFEYLPFEVPQWLGKFVELIQANGRGKPTAEGGSA